MALKNKLSISRRPLRLESKGKILPQREYLANYIEKTLDIPPTLKFEWADYFIEAAKFAKIIIARESGSFQVLYEALPIPKTLTESNVAEPEGVIQKPTVQIAKPDANYQLDSGSLTRVPVSKNRMAVFSIPGDLSQQDIDKIRVILKGIDSGLDGLIGEE